MDNRFDPAKRIGMVRLVAPKATITIEPPLWIEPEKATEMLHRTFTQVMDTLIKDLRKIPVPQGGAIVATRPVGVLSPSSDDVSLADMTVYLFYGTSGADA